MTDPKQISVMAARKMAYARNTNVTSKAGTSISQKRISLVIVALLIGLWAPMTAQQGTVMPVPRLQFLDNNGLPVASGKLYTYAAGTSTPLATYSDVNLAVANTNPIVLNSSGRPSNGVSEVGVFLTAASYKFELQTSAGVTLWTQDNISSVAPYNVNVDVQGTAGEAVSAGELVYLCSGTGCTTAGRWYKTDADLSYASTAATQWGMAPAAISSGESGSVRLSGRVTGLSGLSAGSDYYASSTAGAIVTTPPTNAVRIGRADSTTSLILGNLQAPVGPRGPPCGRLTLTSGTPVTTSNVTAATTVYYTPAGSCNGIDLYDGTVWRPYAFAELSIAVPATTNTNYDVFAYDNAGVVALELTAWTNDTTRATALALQNGVYTKTGALTRRYLGTFRTTAVSGQTEDSVTKRLVWNNDNRVPRQLFVADSASTWTYSTATWRQANANTANKFEVVVGVSGAAVQATVRVTVRNNNVGTTTAVGIGIDSTSAPVSQLIYANNQTSAVDIYMPNSAEWVGYPGAGYHTIVWLEFSQAVGVTTWAGTNADFSRSGMVGVILG